MKASEDGAAFEGLLDYLKRERGFDFGGYKRPSLMRRTFTRLQLLGVKTYADYQDYLAVHPDEFTLLFNTILINVTSFFRDQPAWDYLSEMILPRLIADQPPDAPLRVWSAGCASGQETYSLAMALGEALGLDAFRRRVKLYATDIDEEALAQARQATYTAKDLDSVPEALIKKYFEPNGSRFIFRPELRRLIIFGRHDLTRDAPISRLDLVACRNVLMYFNAEAQTQIIARLHFALKETGYLFLGRSEMLLTHTDLFTPLELKHRLFSKARPSPGNLRDRLPVSSLDRPPAEHPEDNGHLAHLRRLRETLFDVSPLAQAVVDVKGNLVLANERLRQLFGLTAQDLGRPFQDLEISYRPVDLRSPIAQAYAERRSLNLSGVERQLGNGQAQQLDIQVAPLPDHGGAWLGVYLTFQDVTQAYQLQVELRRAQQAAETAYAELQSANEELETTNEELQSTVEELETTNEELQSTNEEMETMNEELQSTNAELQALNDELHHRTRELNLTNAFLDSILDGLHSGVIVMDRDFTIIRWNPRAEDLWGLRPEEAQGKSFFSLDIGLPVDQLRSAIRACLAEGTTYRDVRVEAVNRRGKAFQCRVACTPLFGPAHDRVGVILLLEEVAA